MPEYLAPGVYVEEVRSGPRAIKGVSTSTAGFVGETERGPTLPRLVTSWPEYYRWFGSHVDGPPVLDRPNRYLPYAVQGFFENGGRRLFVARVVGSGATTASLQIPGNPGPTTIVTNGPGDWGNNVMIAVKPASASEQTPPDPAAADWFRLQALYYHDGIPDPFVDPTNPAELANPARKTPDVLEDFDNLSADSSQSNFATTVVNGGSRLIEIVDCQGRVDTAAFTNGILQNGTWVAATRDDYLDASTAAPELRRGLAGLCTIREIALMAIPDEVVIPQLGTDLLDRCDAMRERFAILAHHQDHDDVSQVRPPRDGRYGAFYYPWLRVSAPHTPEGHRLVPPHGHVAGIYARVDVERGVHKAPANEVVRGILARDLPDGRKPLSHTLNRAEQDILNPRGVNVIRDFRPGRGIRVWGARTMSADPEWKYVNVRRLFSYIEQSIDRGTQWVVFEPNAETTWIAVRQAISNFLNTLWRNGALMGNTQEEAFFVRCDRTTMTQDDLDNGRLICLIGIAPVKPAEFVIFRIGQKTAEA